MTGAAPPGVAAGAGRIRLYGAAILAGLTLLAWFGAPWQSTLQLTWFDAYQKIAPRQIDTMPAVIVAVDEQSLAELGQWPWPRSVLARLIDVIASHEPAAIGVDLLLPEPDRLSPAALADRLQINDPALRAKLAALPDNDALLAAAIGRAPVVLGMAGTPERSTSTVRAAPVRVTGGSVLHLRQFDGVQTSLEQFERAAPGHGLLSADPVGAVIRRMPLLASVGDTLTPGLALEMLRIAAGQSSFLVQAESGAVRRAGIPGFLVPADHDGAVWVHFSPRDARRYVRVIDVLNGKLDPGVLKSKLVLVGITGLGLIDLQTVATGERMPGVEVHAQLLENMFESRMLLRPRWAEGAETGVLILAGALLVWAVPVLRQRRSLALAVLLLAGIGAGSFALYRYRLLLFDGATPALHLLVLFGALLALTLAETTRRQKLLEAEVQRQREEAARVTGELEAARRIQTGILPRAEGMAAELRIDIAARMTPAREVGGDLYDFFMLDQDRLFFLIGDVSGKGLPASIFMAVSKALWKSGVLRAGEDSPQKQDIGALMTAANREISRENAEMLFVTLFAGIIDLRTGEMAYCNAGHDNPAVIGVLGGVETHLADGDGPPLCVVDDFEYAGAARRLKPGEALLLVTDGVTEALDLAGELYGGARLQAIAQRPANGERTAAALLEEVTDDVATFTGPAEAADDLTVLVLRWRGPGKHQSSLAA